MSSAQSLKHFIQERLTAAAEEIFAELDKTIVQYEEEIDRQQKLLEICWKPQIKLQRIDVPQYYLWSNEEVLSEQQIYNHQEEPEPCQMMESFEDLEPGQIQEAAEQELYLIKKEQGTQQYLKLKGEHEELCISPEEEQLELKQMTNMFMEIPTYKERVHREPEPNVDHLLVQTSSDAENQSQEVIDHHDTKSKTETVKNKGCQKIRGQSDDVDSPDFKRQQKTNMNKNLLSCKICGKFVVRGTDHMRTHTGEKPFPCLTCGKRFSQKVTLSRHIKIHTGEKPFPCLTCGKRFSQKVTLSRHIKIHTGEKPFPCLICGKRFSLKVTLSRHIKIHTGEKPFACLTCGKRFSLKDTLSRHIKIHTREKSYSCSICGKSFTRSFDLSRHLRTHTCQRPVSFSCLVCGQEFSERKSLFHHSRNHI